MALPSICLVLGMVAPVGVVVMAGAHRCFLFQRPHLLQDPREEIWPLEAKYERGRVIWE